MSFKKFLLIVLSISLCIPLAACNSTDGSTPSDSTEPPMTDPSNTPTSSETTDTKPKKDNTPAIEDQHYALSNPTTSLLIKLIGRSYVKTDGIVCDLAADGIEFSAYVEGKLSLAVSASRDCYFTLFVDGKRIAERLFASAGETTVALGSYEGEHSFRLLKQTESMDTLTVLKTLSFKGYLGDRPADRRTYIEFIGDSLTSGYGILTDGSATDGGAPIYKDATKTFAFLSAEAIKADCSLVSCTGIGVVRGFRTFPMADFYPKVSYFRDQNAEVSIADSGRIPDAVVINLSTNDQSKQVSPAEFEPAAKALIEQIQSIRGKNVPIVWVLNANVTSLNPSIKKVMESFGGEDAGFYTVEIKLDSKGGGGHPSEESQAEEATKLAKFFKNKLYL